MVLELANSSGQVLASNSGVTIDPDSGQPTSGAALSYSVATTGNYLVSLSNQQPATAPAQAAARGYTLNIRPIGMAPSPNAAFPPAGALGFQGGGMYAYLQTGQLNIIGPTGYGFDIRGNWSVVTIAAANGQTQLAFGANAGIELDTGLGLLPVPLPPGSSLLVVTQPSGWNGANFGEISSTSLQTGLAWLDDLAQSFNQLSGFTMSLPDGSGSLTVNQGTSVQLGLALGSTINASVDANAPLNAAIPYLYFVAQTGDSVSASFGNVSLSVGTTRSLSVIVDPADPSLYVGVESPPVKLVNSVGIGLSWNGLIPLTPVAPPSMFSGTFTGNFYVQAGVDVPIPYTKGIASVDVNGALDLGIDATHDHALRDALMESALVGTVSSALAAGNLVVMFANDPNLVDDVAYAVNGSLGLKLSAPDFDASATFNLAQGTFIDTGTATPNLYFRGQASDNLFQGTALENYMSFIRPTTTFVVDGLIQPVANQFTATFTTTYAFFGFNATGTAAVSGSGVFTSSDSFSATTNGGLTFLGGQLVSYTGVVSAGGGFQLNGTGLVTIAGFTLSTANITVVPQGITLSGSVNLGPIGTPTFNSELTRDGNFALTATIATNFGTYAPQTTASLTLSNAGLSAWANVEFLGNTALLRGSVQPNLDFTLTGSTEVTFPIPYVNPRANVAVTLQDSGGTVSLSGNFDLVFSASVRLYPYGPLVTVAFNLNSTISLVSNQTYAGTATVSATGPGGYGISATASVTNNALNIKVLGFTVLSIPLPF
jgi:hypothetical protein